MLEIDALEKLSRYLDSNQSVGLAYSAFEHIDAYDRLINLPTEPFRCVPVAFGIFGIKELPFESGETPFPALMAHFHQLPSCSLFRRSVFIEAGKWDEAYSNAGMCAEDKDLVLRTSLIAPVHLVADCLLRYRRHGSNGSTPLNIVASQAFLEAKWERLLRTLPQDQNLMVRKAFFFDKFVAMYLTNRAFSAAIRSRDAGRSMRLAISSIRKTLSLVKAGSHWLLIK